MNKIVLASVLLIAMSFSGCSQPGSNRIAIAVRGCVVHGAEWSFNAHLKATPATQRTSAATNLILKVSDIWETGANIAFVPVLDADGEIPEIVVPGANGLGDIDQPQDSSLTTQTLAAAQACDAAWRSSYPAGTVLPGIPVIFARRFLNDDGTDSRQLGVDSPNLLNYVRNGGKDLCDRPYNILASDVVGRVSLVATANSDRAPESYFESALATSMAHEIGHALLLAHGDGRDNDGNGRWDERCDNKEYMQYDTATTDSDPTIMNATPANETLITPLQAELARSAARYVPGVAGGPFP